MANVRLDMVGLDELKGKLEALNKKIVEVSQAADDLFTATVALEIKINQQGGKGGSRKQMRKP